jgi:Flp pilus assembly protein TadG
MANQSPVKENPMDSVSPSVQCLKQIQARLKRSGERGQVAALLVVLLPVLLALVGLVVDGGIMFASYRLGRVTMDSAALAAATALDEPAFWEPENEVILDAARAYQAALNYAALNGKGRVAVTGVNVSQNMVNVYGVVTSPTIFMRIVNIDQITFNLSAEAELKYGITEEGQ